LKIDIVLIIVGRVVIALAGLVSLRVMTHYFSPEKYGEYSLLIVIQSMCGLVLVSPLGQYLNVNTHKWYDEQTLFARLDSYRVYLFFVSLVSSGLVLVFLSDKVEKLIMSAFSLFIIVWALNWNSTLVPLLNMLGARVAFIVWSILTAIMGLLGSIFFVIYVSPDASSWLLGQAIGMVIGVLGAKYSLSKFLLRVKKEKHRMVTKSVVMSFCLPLSVATLFMWFALNGYRLFVEHFWGLAALAFFVVGFQVAGSLWSLVGTIAMQFLHPYYYRASSDTKNEVKLINALSDLANILIPVYIFLSVIMLLGAKQIFYILVDEQYFGAIKFFYLAVIVELVRASSYIFTHAVHVKRNTKMLIRPYFIYALAILICILFSGFLELSVEMFSSLMPINAILFLIFMYLQMRKVVAFGIKWTPVICLSCLLFVVGFYVKYFNFNNSLTVLSSLSFLFFLGGAALALIYFYLINSVSFKRLLSEDVV
jgi:O-antigen/teichoic acid export membrane protein